MAKASAVKSRSMAINQLKAVRVAAEPAQRESLAGLSNPKLIRHCSQLRPTPSSGPQVASRHTLRLLAKRILHLIEEINNLTARISTAINACAPKLLDLYGVGPDTAAVLLTAAGDNPDRLASEASLPPSAASAPWKHRLERPSVAGSTAAAIARPKLAVRYEATVLVAAIDEWL